MFRKIPPMNSLRSRKQLLIVESELNRTQLSADLIAVSLCIHTLAARAKTFGTIASSAWMLVVGLAALRRHAPAESTAKASWTQRILKGVSLASSLWMTFRRRGTE